MKAYSDKLENDEFVKRDQKKKDYSKARKKIKTREIQFLMYNSKEVNRKWTKY